MKDSLLIQNKSKLDRQPEKMSRKRRKKKTSLSPGFHEYAFCMNFGYQGFYECIQPILQKKNWNSKILFHVSCTSARFSIVFYTPTKVSVQQHIKKVNNQASGLCCDIVLLCFGLYKTWPFIRLPAFSIQPFRRILDV